MKTLVVYYSKTGNTKKAAEAVINELGDCDVSMLTFDEKANTIGGAVDPSEYGRVILLSPIWAFALSTPMKLYLNKYGKAIQSYSLIVTYSLFGLRGCVNNCVRAIGKQPLKAISIKGKCIQAENFDIKPAL